MKFAMYLVLNLVPMWMPDLRYSSWEISSCSSLMCFTARGFYHLTRALRKVSVSALPSVFNEKEKRSLLLQIPGIVRLLGVLAEVLGVLRLLRLRLGGCSHSACGLAHHFGEADVPEHFRDLDVHFLPFLDAGDEQDESLHFGDAVALRADRLYLHVQFLVHLDRNKSPAVETASPIVVMHCSVLSCLV